MTYTSPAYLPVGLLLNDNGALSSGTARLAGCHKGVACVISAIEIRMAASDGEESCWVISTLL